MDLTLVKIKIDESAIGGDALIPIGVNAGKLSDIDYGSQCNAELKEITEKRRRSHEQLSLYWVGCRFIAEQTDNNHFNTQRKVDQQTKLHCHLVEDEIKYRLKETGEVRAHLVLGSVSYSKLKHLDACAFFSDAFDYQTELYNLIQKRLNPNHKNIFKDEYIELLKQFIKNHYRQANGL